MTWRRDHLAETSRTKMCTCPKLTVTSFVFLILANFTLQQESSGAQEIPKTSFSCAGRVPGYYADPETGCQAYHMCEAGGRQFSYRCPEQTLFQQRMMVCDHWFMVDCKTSPQHYAANLLLGDKTKQFISAGETVHREFVPDAKQPRFSGVRNQNKKPQREQSKNKEEIKQNVTSTLSDIQQRTFPTTIFSKGTTLSPLSARTINTQIIGDVIPKHTTTSTLINKITTQRYFAQTTPKPTETTSQTLNPYSFFTTTTTKSRLIDNPRQGFNNRQRTFYSLSTEINSALHSTKTLPITTTEIPTTNYNNNDLIYPATINSLLRNSDNDGKEPALLQIIPDTRRMFYIPDSFENIPSEFEEQHLDFQPTASDSNDHFRAMRFNKDIGDFNNGACPSKCFPAFFRPGSCEPCVVLR